MNHIRHIRQEFAEAHPCGAWVDTDDLNDKKDGKKVVNDLHYIPQKTGAPCWDAGLMNGELAV